MAGPVEFAVKSKKAATGVDDYRRWISVIVTSVFVLLIVVAVSAPFAVMMVVSPIPTCPKLRMVIGLCAR